MAGPAGGGHVGAGFPMNQGMGQGQFSGFPQHQQAHQQQQFQAMQQQQQQQQVTGGLDGVLCADRQSGERERGEGRERKREKERERV